MTFGLNNISKNIISFVNRNVLRRRLYRRSWADHRRRRRLYLSNQNKRLHSSVNSPRYSLMPRQRRSRKPNKNTMSRGRKRSSLLLVLI